VFYDTTFYLLVPIVRSVYKRMQKNYIFCLMAVGLGATLTHTLTPPTPGPIAVAETLAVPFGTMLIVSFMVAALTALPALAIACFMNWMMPNPTIHFEDEIASQEETKEESATVLPSPNLFWSFAPIIFPVVLIASQTTIEMLEKAGRIVWSDDLFVLRNILRLLGDPRFALIVAAVVAMGVLFRNQKLSFDALGKKIEPALLGAGIIILITAAGGAFGETLRQAGIGGRIQELCQGEGGAGMSGVGLLLLAFSTAALIKTAQGSSTVAIITTAGIFAGILDAADAVVLPYNTAYLAVTIGLGSCVTGWMNDSGFWIFCRMGGIKETDALKTWSFGLILLGLSGLLIVLVLSRLLPLTSLP
jgi:GntP family gluconate:H+ symporter